MLIACSSPIRPDDDQGYVALLQCAIDDLGEDLPVRDIVDVMEYAIAEARARYRAAAGPAIAIGPAIAYEDTGHVIRPSENSRRASGDQCAGVQWLRRLRTSFIRRIRQILRPMTCSSKREATSQPETERRGREPRNQRILDRIVLRWRAP